MAPTLYSEALFYACLKHSNETAERVERLTWLALQHLEYAVDTWTALRRAIGEEVDPESDANRALWYVADALLKHAPHVFVPLASPRLLENVVQQLPWRLVRSLGRSPASVGADATTGGVGPLLWFERMVRSWEGLLPAKLYAEMELHASQCRSGAQLDLLVSAATGGEGETMAADAHGPVNAAEVRRLQESWEVLRSVCRSAVAAEEEEEAARHFLELAQRSMGSHEEAAEESASRPAAAAPSQLAKASEVEVDDDEEEEEDYAPEYIRGAVPRALPVVELPSQPRRRREARRRMREEDDF